MIDLLLLALLLLTVIFSYKKGALSTLSGVGSYLISLFVTYRYTDPVADFCYEKIVRNIAIDRIKAAIFNGSAYKEENKWFDYVKEASKMSTKASDIAETITDNYLSDVLLQMTKVVVSILLFVLVSALLGFLFGRLAKRLHHTGGVGTLDRLGGGLLGLVKGFLLVAAISVALSFLNDSGWEKIPDSIYDSLSASYFVTLVHDNLLSDVPIVQPR